jgi:SAM-dependent methyltransferase
MTPIGADWGFERGLPIDRWYIERFLQGHTREIGGRVLEIDTDRYTRKFGGDRVTKSDVLHLNEMRPGITMVGDLASPDSFPSELFDCIVLTQTVNLVFDARAALLSVRKMLKPGGVALITVPGLSRMFGGEDGTWGHCWGFTTRSLSQLLEDVFAEDSVSIDSCGNVLSTIAFMHGIASEELKVSELEYHDPEYQLLVLASVTKRGGKP